MGNCAAYAIAASDVGVQMGITPKEPEEAAVLFNNVADGPKPAAESIYSPVYSLFVKNKATISSFLTSTLILASTPVLYAFGNGEGPIYFSRKGAGLTLMLNGLGYDKALNTAVTTSRTRAAAIITQMLLPDIQKMERLFTIPGVTNFSCTIMYGCRDFDKPKTLTGAVDVESITVCAPVGLYRQYITKAISEESFMRQAEFYIKEYDVKSGIKRIELSVN